MSTSDKLIFAVNEKVIAVNNPDPEITLLYYLRYTLGLRGTKLGCGEGGCGACTVMLSQYDVQLKTVKHFSVYACITSICKIHLMNVTTVEGVGGMHNMHPIQDKIVEYNGTQCGFCTPGMVLSMYTLLSNNPAPPERDIEDAFDGNLCRCTGYSAILTGCKTFACSEGDKSQAHEKFFPPELMKNQEQSLKFSGKRVTWHIPITLNEVIELKQSLPKAIMLSGGTIVTLLEVASDYICVYQIPEFEKIRTQIHGLQVGAAVTLTDLEKAMKQLIKEKPKYKTQILASIVNILPHVASNQVRNVGSVVGNLCASEFAADLHNIFLAALVKIKIIDSKGSERELTIDQTFFEGKGINPDEIIVYLEFPWSKQGDIFQMYKQGKRRTCSFAIVNSAFFISVKNNIVEDCRLVFGGVSPVTKFAIQTSQNLKGREWNKDILDTVLDDLINELDVSADISDGMEEYKETLACSFFVKFYLYVTQTLKMDIPPGEISGIDGVALPLTQSTECYGRVPEDQPANDPVGRPIPKESACSQVTGTARFLDDILRLESELSAAEVISQRVHATILEVDVKETLALEGVIDYISYADVPDGGSNETGVNNQEELFAKSKVNYCGQLIGLVIAKDRMIAKRGAELVKITYQDLDVILTIEDAIAAKSFYEYNNKIKRGDPEKIFPNCYKKLTGKLKIGGQEHFYMESQSCIVAPTGEDRCIRVISSSQSLQFVKSYISRALGIMRNKIICSTKRIGGAFGGKNSRSCTLAAATAVAVHKLERPIRIFLDRQNDMKYTGGRHPYLAHYEVSFDENGLIMALSMELFSNAGYSIDFSASVMNCSLYKLDNAYFIPNIYVKSHLCKTNLASNTSMRGYGGPQVAWVMENILNRVACSLEKPIDQIQKMNFYVDNQTTPFGMVIEDCTITACWDELLRVSDYDKKIVEKDEFNKNNIYKKRGIGTSPVKFGVGYDNNSENQGGALVHILKDGSVMLYHGGIETGQGLNTKLMQICSRALGIPITKIHINDTTTNTIANPSGTGSSVSTDIYGLAIVNACNILNERMSDIKNAHPDFTWEQLVNATYKTPIDLTAKGYYHSDIKGVDWSGPEHIGVGDPVGYYTYGCACTLVEVDVLTGDFKVLETNIVMDVGRSINPVIDIGQIEGAFLQGMGLHTLEELIYLDERTNSQKGMLSSTGPSTYKIPSFTDVPANIKVYLLPKSNNIKGVYGSKGIGEPALLLGNSVFFGIRQAVLATSSYSQANIEDFVFNSPATVEKIRMNCKDSITEKVTKKGKLRKKNKFIVP